MHDLKSIISSNTQEYEGLKYLYLPYPDSERLLIVLSPHNQGEKFTWVSQIIPNQKVNLLYLNNPPDDYYDLANNHASYKEIIKNITTKYFKKDVFIMGSSMSGTAAIRIGIDMGFMSGKNHQHAHV